MDWNQLKAFLETAEAGSLSAAARKLGLSQPTLSRQVAAIETQLGVALFERVGGSMTPTATGLALLEHARTMGAAAQDLQLAATGHSQATDGLVTVSASHTIAAYVLPPVIAALRAKAPGLVVEIVASDALSDLQRREADIAVRHVRPDQPDLIGKMMREGTAGFYASRLWVEKHGHPKTADDATRCDWVGLDRRGQYLQYLHLHGLMVRAEQFVCHTENSLTSWALVQQGLGIAPVMDEIAPQLPGLVRVLDDVPPIRFPIWLVTHKELRTARRIRLVFDALADHLSDP